VYWCIRLEQSSTAYITRVETPAPDTKLSLLGLAIVFLVIALIAYAVGARGIAGFTMEIAKILIVVFLILFVLTLLFGGSVNI
jgi:uncharacterized membrane protein YtjA (UPF0391 family)